MPYVYRNKSLRALLSILLHPELDFGGAEAFRTWGAVKT